MLQQDFKLNEIGDIVIDDDGLQLAIGREVFRQAFRQILSTRLSEYFLNLDEGLDFDVFLGQKDIDEDAAINALQNAGLQVRDFVKFNIVDFRFDKQARTLHVSFQATFEDGYQETFSEEVSLGV